MAFASANELWVENERTSLPAILDVVMRDLRLYLAQETSATS
jgi:hypothetical protein